VLLLYANGYFSVSGILSSRSASAQKLPLDRVNFFRGSATKWQNVSGRAVIFITQRTLCYSVFRDSRKLNALVHCIAQQVKSVAIV
jgi:hypothetical protein